MNSLAPPIQTPTPSPTPAHVSTRLTRTYAKGEHIFYCGDLVTGLLTVVVGLVRLVHFTEEGREITVRLAGPGDMLEPNFLTPQARCTADALCVTPHVALAYMPCDAFSQGVPAALFRQVAQQLASAETRVAFLSCSVEARVAWLLARGTLWRFAP